MIFGISSDLVQKRISESRNLNSEDQNSERSKMFRIIFDQPETMKKNIHRSLSLWSSESFWNIVRQYCIIKVLEDVILMHVQLEIFEMDPD